jgi:hypothetical protein
MFNFSFCCIFVVAGCIAYVLAVVMSFSVVFLYCVCAFNACNVCCLSVLLLYYSHRAKAQLKFNIYTYTYIYIYSYSEPVMLTPNAKRIHLCNTCIDITT